MSITAYTGADIFDGTTIQQGMALLVEDGCFVALIDPRKLTKTCIQLDLDGGTILPGFVDLQVNGGGGVMFNDDQSVATLRTIAEAHATTGTQAILPTLITDTPQRTRAAIVAVKEAVAQSIPGIIGLHLEGPHLSIVRKGAHDPNLIRPMEEVDLTMLCDAAKSLPNLMVTLAPENATPAQIARLRAAGVIVSLGHTDCSHAQARSSFDAGATCVTHLFNAMSQLGNREPGLVGATLEDGRVSAGLIADDIHVHIASIKAAMAAKTGPGQIFLVTDAMSPVGSDITEFILNGRRVLRRDGRLTLENGTLAGADLDMPTALKIMTERAGMPKALAMAMATSAPASLLSDPMGFGAFHIGDPLHAIHLANDYSVRPLSAFQDHSQMKTAVGS
jgi:N-acetylglucosamine-6-phosphate deacetylase